MPLETGANVVGAINGDAHARVHGVTVIDDELRRFTIVGFLDERNLHAPDKIVVITIHVKQIHQVSKVTHSVGMAIEITVHIAECVVYRVALQDGTQMGLRFNWARQIRYVFTDVTQL